MAWYQRLAANLFAAFCLILASCIWTAVACSSSCSGACRGNAGTCGVSQRWSPLAPPSALQTFPGGRMDRRDARTRCADRVSQHLRSRAVYTWRGHTAAGCRDTPLRRVNRHRAARIARPGCAPASDHGICCWSRGCGSHSSLAHRGGLVRSGKPPRWLFCEHVPNAELGAWEADTHAGGGRDRRLGAPALVNAGSVMSVGDALSRI